jgi:DNA-binding beta-propeller fold protein YncE
MRRSLLLAAGILSGLSLAPSIAPAADVQAGKIVARIKLSGEGGWDYLTMDPDARRLYVAHSTMVQVLDVDTGKVVGEVANTPGVHGVALVPELGRGFTSNGRDSSVTVFDLHTLALVSRIHLTEGAPDAIVYDPASKRVFTLNHASGTATAIEAATGSVLGTVAVGGTLEFAVADGRGTVFVNVEDSSSVAAIDTKSLQVKSRWPLAPGQNPTGLAMDVEHHRLFAGCHNQQMVVVDADSGRVVATLPIGGGTDGTAFDPATSLAFSSNGEGTLTVIHEDSPAIFAVRGSVATQQGARTLAVDPKTHRVYLATAEFGPVPAPTAETPNPRPARVPGSFVILVVEPSPSTK